MIPWGDTSLNCAKSTKLPNSYWTGHNGPGLIIIGLDYVGLPLAAELVRSGLAVVGFDLNDELTKTLNSGRSGIANGSSDDLADILSGGFRATADEAELPGCAHGNGWRARPPNAFICAWPTVAATAMTLPLPPRDHR
jgi:hypothetical protein